MGSRTAGGCKEGPVRAVPCSYQADGKGCEPLSEPIPNTILTLDRLDRSVAPVTKRMPSHRNQRRRTSCHDQDHGYAEPVVEPAWYEQRKLGFVRV